MYGTNVDEEDHDLSKMNNIEIDNRNLTYKVRKDNEISAEPRIATANGAGNPAITTLGISSTRVSYKRNLGW